MANEKNLKPYKKGEQRTVDSGRKGGKNKKGSKHISTYIQEMLADPNYIIKLKDGTEIKEVPVQAIIKTAIAKGISGDVKWADWLAKHGFGTRAYIGIDDPVKKILEQYGIDGEDDDEDGDDAPEASDTPS